MKTGKTARKLLHHENAPMLLVLLGLIVLVILMEGFFVKGGDFSSIAFVRGLNISNVLAQVSITGVLAIGMTVIMLSGGMDLSCGQMVSFAGCLLSFLLVKQDWALIPAMLVVILSCVAFQAIAGYMIAKTHLEPFIVTLGFMSIYQGLSYLITNGREITMGDQLRFVKNVKLSFGESSFYIGIPVLALLVFTVIMWLVLKYTKFGRWIYQVGGNENAAYLSGINVKRFKVILYALNGLFIALGTIIMLGRVGAGSPTMGSGKEIDVIAAVVVGGTALSGGKGNMWGTFIGVLLMGIISNAMNILGVNPYYQYVMKGLLILISIYIGYLGSKGKNMR